MLNDVLDLIIYWSHAGAALFIMGYNFCKHWYALAATEQMVRDAMNLGPLNPKRDEVLATIDKTQRAAIWKMRVHLVGMILLIPLLYIMLSF